MIAFILRRAAQAIGVMAAMSVIVFLGVQAIGNPIDVLLPQDADQQMRLEIIARYGLDQPLWRQYLAFAGNLLAGDFGRSFIFNIPVLQLIAERAPATLELVLIAMAVATLVGVPLGMYAGYRPQSVLSRIIMGWSIIGFSVPTFWVGLILIMVFAINLGWLPPGGRGDTIEVLGTHWSFLTVDGLRHLVLPVFNLALFKMSMMIRLARAGTREVMMLDCIRLARAAGLSEATVLRRHVLKLISVPIVTIFGIELGSTLAFAVVTETIFNWPGLGKLIIDSIMLLDRPVMVAYLILVAMMFVMINFTVDLLHVVLDPRLRHAADK